MLSFTKTENGLVFGIPGVPVIGRMWCTTTGVNRYRYHLEVNDVGDALMSAVLASFQYARSCGEIPLVSE